MPDFDSRQRPRAAWSAFKFFVHNNQDKLFQYGPTNEPAAFKEYCRKRWDKLPSELQDPYYAMEEEDVYRYQTDVKLFRLQKRAHERTDASRPHERTDASDTLLTTTPTSKIRTRTHSVNVSTVSNATSLSHRVTPASAVEHKQNDSPSTTLSAAGTVSPPPQPNALYPATDGAQVRRVSLPSTLETDPSPMITSTTSVTLPAAAPSPQQLVSTRHQQTFQPMASTRQDATAKTAESNTSTALGGFSQGHSNMALDASSVNDIQQETAAFENVGNSTGATNHDIIEPGEVSERSRQEAADDDSEDGFVMHDDSSSVQSNGQHDTTHGESLSMDDSPSIPDNRGDFGTKPGDSRSNENDHTGPSVHSTGDTLDILNEKNTVTAVATGEAIVPRDNDVLHFKSPGHRKMMALVDQHYQKYWESDRSLRGGILKEIIAKISQDGGRFLKKSKAVVGNPWMLQSKEEARTRVQKAFLQKFNKANCPSSKPKPRTNKKPSAAPAFAMQHGQWYQHCRTLKWYQHGMTAPDSMAGTTAPAVLPDSMAGTTASRGARDSTTATTAPAFLPDSMTGTTASLWARDGMAETMTPVSELDGVAGESFSVGSFGRTSSFDLDDADCDRRPPTAEENTYFEDPVHWERVFESRKHDLIDFDARPVVDSVAPRSPQQPALNNPSNCQPLETPANEANTVSSILATNPSAVWFLERLRSALDSQEVEFMNWMPNGKQFCISSSKLDRDEVLKMFQFEQMSSFLRKLNQLGFQRGFDKEKMDVDIFGHPDFVRQDNGDTRVSSDRLELLPSQVTAPASPPIAACLSETTFDKSIGSAEIPSKSPTVVSDTDFIKNLRDCLDNNKFEALVWTYDGKAIQISKPEVFGEGEKEYFVDRLLSLGFAGIVDGEERETFQRSNFVRE